MKQRLLFFSMVLLFLSSCMPTQYLVGDVTKEERLEASGWTCQTSTVIVTNKTDEVKYFVLDDNQVQVPERRKFLFLKFAGKVKLKVSPGEHSTTVLNRSEVEDFRNWFTLTETPSGVVVEDQGRVYQGGPSPTVVETYPCFVYRHHITE